MRIRLLRKDAAPLVLDDVSLMVVEDMNGNPVSVACPYLTTEHNEAFEVAHCRDPEFTTLLRRLGINNTVIVRDVTPDVDFS